MPNATFDYTVPIELTTEELAVVTTAIECGGSDPDWPQTIEGWLRRIIHNELQRSQPTSDRRHAHQPVVVPLTDGRFAVICGGCSFVAGDYTYPCRLAVWTDVPAVLIADGVQ